MDSATPSRPRQAGTKLAAQDAGRRDHTPAFCRFMDRVYTPSFGSVDVREFPTMSRVEVRLLDEAINPEWCRLEGKYVPAQYERDL